MPFRSEKQKRFLWSNHPEIAREWTKKYGSKIKRDWDKLDKKARRKLK